MEPPSYSYSTKALAFVISKAEFFASFLTDTNWDSMRYFQSLKNFALDLSLWIHMNYDMKYEFLTWFMLMIEKHGLSWTIYKEWGPGNCHGKFTDI